ncbi:MAG: hypothetical protein V4819_25530 [Verrucomicrobiota bacterium]
MNTAICWGISRSMKTLLIAAASILASVQLCSADLFGKFNGTWNQNGLEPGARITTVYKRFQEKGMVATSTIVFPGVAKSTSITKYYDSGRIKGEMRRNGIAISAVSGTWSVSGDTLKAQIKVSAPFIPTSRGEVKTTLVSANKIRTVTTSSEGVRNSATMTRQR